MANSLYAPFQICGGTLSTTSLAVGMTAQFLTLPPIPSNGTNAVFTVVGNQEIYIACEGEVATLTGSMPLLANTSRAFSIPGGAFRISAIARVPGSTLYITTGQGS